ncbi:MAG: PAC2 family protein [Candidatus Woesearchaeota archaeon]
MVLLVKKPQKPIILLGFPGFGLVGTIATQYIIEHLEMQEIGKILLEELPATIAIHEGKILNPLGIYYHEEKNIVIIHSIMPLSGLEWKVGEKLQLIFKELNPWRIINLEGVGTNDQEEQEPQLYYFSTRDEINKEMQALALQKLDNGILVGISPTLLLKAPELPLVNLFASTHAHLPDSNAAAALIRVIDRYLNLTIDPQPLVEQAKVFEDRLRTLLQQGTKTKKIADEKTLSYLG